MTKNVKRFFSMLLALSMVFSLVVPAAATETEHNHAHVEETTEETYLNVSLDNVTVSAADIGDLDLEIDLESPLILADPDTKVDMEDPAILAFETELEEFTVLNAEGDPVPLTPEQIQNVLGLYQQYLNYQTEHADVLGLQTPFFLSYNDNGEDGLGILGEMLVLSGVPVDAVRAGYMTYDDLTGMILNFYYGDQLGVQYYGSAVKAARDDAMNAIKASGAQTEAQKLLVLNDWLAHKNTFDMPYIMNAEKEEDARPMVAETPVKHEHYDDVFAVMNGVYTDSITEQFKTQIYDGLKAVFKTQYYTEAIKNIIYQGGLAQARQDEELVEALKPSVNWDEAYAAAEKEVYDEAYAEFMRNNHEHDMEVSFVWTPTEDADGNITAWTCEEAEAVCKFEDCTAEFTVVVETSDKVTAEADCTENGLITYTATATVTIAGVEGEDGVVGEFKETKEAVIVAVGHKDEDADNKCDVCEEPIHVHDVTVTVVWAEDNTATATAVCAVEDCSETMTAEISVTSVTEDATCSKDGQTTYTAKVERVTTGSGANVADYTVKNAENVVGIPATGEHEYDMDLTTGECVNEGCDFVHNDHVDITGDGYCDVCYAPIAVEHEHVYNWVETTAPTCTEKGVETYQCTCGDTDGSTREVDALGHSMDGGTVTTEATCENAGLKTKSCQRGCGYTETETIDALGHSMDEGTVTTEATCETAGVMTKSCLRGCGHTETETIDALGHHFVDGVCDRENCDATEAVACEHEWPGPTGNGTCTKCGAEHVAHEESPYDPGVCMICGALLSTYSTKDAAATVAEEGEGESEKTLEEQADEYANSVVAEKQAEIEAKAAETSGLNAAIDQYVTGGTEDIDTEIEEQVWAEAEAFVAQEEVAAALEKDPAGFVDSQEMFQQQVPVTDPDGNTIMMPLSQQLHMGWEQFWADAEANGVEVDPVNAPGYKMTVDQIVEQQMNTPMADLPPKYDEQGNVVVDEEGNTVHMTPNEAIPVFAAQAAEGLTGGIINYWEGSHFGALGFGTSVCLGYTKAFTYLVQCMHPEIYGTSGESTNMNVASNWKTRDQIYVYNENNEIDINQNYIVDAVRISFAAQVTMYGQTEDNFNSDHFWNAVKVDGQWYYIDPCYTDVFTEVMMRDRVETDGQMNHLYFLFSHPSCADLYEGNYSEIKTLYETVATDKTYEDSWMSRIKSNTYFADGYAYYLYDSTDMITLMEEFENENTEADIEAATYKIVRHQLDTTDAGDGDEDFETLVIFNYTANDDSDPVARVWDPESRAMVDNELLTELWNKHAAYGEIYPSIAVNAALYEGKVYFNLANCILSYDVATSEVALVKEYNTVYGVRDKTNPFGGMAFSTTTADKADFTVENHPIAGMTIKNDGIMYVSIATNFAFISGKSDRCDPASDGYGYAYEESNFNSAYTYNSYMDFGDYSDDELASYGYTREINDNDEFMWTANFVEKLSMRDLTGSHSYSAVSVAATCGVDAFTENRCTKCGAVEPGSRVYEEGTALNHHYVGFDETFYTKDDGGAWNTGFCYVCTICGFATTEPKEPTGEMDTEENRAKYEEALEIYNDAKERAGHTYVATGETWAEDNSSVTFQTLICSANCPVRKPHLDCLKDDDTITITLAEAVTAETSVVKTIGTCPDGLIEVYEAAGEVEANGEPVAYAFTKEVQLDPAECTFVEGVCQKCGNCLVKRIAGSNRVETALEVADATKEALGIEKFDAVILANGADTSFADALTGSYLATVKKAPILLYMSSGMSADATNAYIEENLKAGGTVYLLGGEGVIPSSVEQDLSAYTVKRLAGDTRFDTNLAILQEAGIGEQEILIARGLEFADSLPASATGLPIMVVNEVTGKLTDAQIDFLKGLDGNALTILGGTGAVSEEMEAAIEEIVGKDVDRVYGETRTMTSVEIAKRYFDSPDFAVAAYSLRCPDGLCGGPLAYAMKAPLLLVHAGQELFANEYTTENEIIAGYVLGGTAVISDESTRRAFSLAENAVIEMK